MARIVFALVVFVVLLLPHQSMAQKQSYDLWLQGVASEAIAKGIHPAVVNSALSGIVFDERVVGLDRRQPENTIKFSTYSKNVLHPLRVKRGSALLKKHEVLLKEISDFYGVPSSIIVALWGIESNFGNSTGNFNLINSLATLAYEGRRAAFFRNELIFALGILDSEHMAPDSLEGSWAGAMGQCQFMPSVYTKYAIDHDQDGRKDIWGNTEDVLASIANYLVAEGWQRNLTWGREVKLTRSIPSSAIGLDKIHSLKHWQNLGVRAKNGSPLPIKSLQASLIRLDGTNGRSFLVYDNFRALMRWNRSTYFATTVGLLADKIK
ncbi:MAG: lytic murein transglycosylase [Alphaproteobacteria bacterium]|nr:lytic murein transglycosylase [Alphaproteobacteria bacterium]